MLSTDTNTERDNRYWNNKTTENINIEVSKNIELTIEISKQLDISTETIEIPDKIITETTNLPEIDPKTFDRTKMITTVLGQISEIITYYYIRNNIIENVIYRY